MKLRFLIIMCLLAITAVISFLFVFTDKDKISIGFIGDFSGQSHEIGIQSRNGALLAVEEINRGGGLWGRELELIIRDNQNYVEKAKSGIREFIDRKIPLVIGPQLSKMVDVVLRESSGEDILVISPAVSTDRIAGLDDNFLRLNTTASSDGKTLAKAVLDRGDKRVALVRSEANSEYTGYVVQGVKEVLLENGCEIVYNQTFSSKEDFVPIVLDLIELDADALVISAVGEESASIIQQYAMRAALPNLYSCQWGKASEIVNYGGRTVEGMIVVGEYCDRDYEQITDLFKENYRDHFSSEPNIISIYAYESVMVLAEGIRKSGRNWDVENLKEDILNLESFNGVTSSFKLDRYGDVVREMALYIIKSNSYEPYYPQD